MLLDDQESQLVLVDYQARLMPAIFEADLVLANAMRLAQAAHWMEVPTYGTEQNPDKLGQNPAELRALCRRTIPKMSFSACPDGLSEVLRPAARAPAGNARSLPKHLQKAVPQEPTRQSIVIAGCEAHVCLLQTVLDLLEELHSDLGKTIVMVTHDPKAAARAKRLIHLEKGVLVPDEAAVSAH